MSDTMMSRPSVSEQPHEKAEKALIDATNNLDTAERMVKQRRDEWATAVVACRTALVTRARIQAITGKSKATVDATLKPYID